MEAIDEAVMEIVLRAGNTHPPIPTVKALSFQSRPSMMGISRLK